MKVVGKPIQMIAWFNEDGYINPIRFKMEEDWAKVIKINRVIRQEQEKLAGNIMEKFTCTTFFGGVEKIFEVKFDAKSYKWILFKI